MINFYEFSNIINESIQVKHPVRKAVAEIETYWAKPGAALSTIQNILHDYGFIIPIPSFNVHDRTPEYTQRFNIEKIVNPQDPNSESEDANSSLIFSWHWMPSGKQVEITAYIN